MILLGINNHVYASFHVLRVLTAVYEMQLEVRRKRIMIIFVSLVKGTASSTIKYRYDLSYVEPEGAAMNLNVTPRETL